MAFNPDQTTPWPLHRRVQIAFGLTFCAPTLSTSLGDWIFDPHVVLTLPGDPITRERENVPSGGKGAFWAADREPGEPLRAQFFWLQFAWRVLGFDLGFELWYRCRDAHKQERNANVL